MGELVKVEDKAPSKRPKKGATGLTGRSKFDYKHRKVILSATEKGLPAQRAAHLAGLHENTVYNWLSRGRECDEEGNPLEPKYTKFLLDYKLAESKWVEKSLAAIDEAGEHDWKARAWLLERRFPQEFGRAERMNISTDEPIKVVLSW